VRVLLRIVGETRVDDSVSQERNPSHKATRCAHFCLLASYVTGANGHSRRECRSVDPTARACTISHGCYPEVDASGESEAI
jgi:hypothetical protein